MNFPKTAKTLDDQIALLKSRGLYIKDEKKAKHHLSNISYYRLSAYFLSFQRYNDPHYAYMPRVTFEEIMSLYRFDRELRVIALDAIERIEVSLRCRIVYEFCTRYGNNWYEDKSFYSRGHAELMKKIRGELSRTKETFIQHYYGKYTNPQNPPAWMAIEVLSFGQLSIMFKNLLANDAKKAVADHFGVGIAVLESCIENLAYIRNLCAHHSRLWNRTLTVRPTIPKRPKFDWINLPPTRVDKIYISLCIMAYLLQRADPTSYFTGKLKTLVCRLPKIDIKAAGFNEKWLSDPFWKNQYASWTYWFRIMIFRSRTFVMYLLSLIK